MSEEAKQSLDEVIVFDEWSTKITFSFLPGTDKPAMAKLCACADAGGYNVYTNEEESLDAKCIEAIEAWCARARAHIIKCNKDGDGR